LSDKRRKETSVKPEIQVSMKISINKSEIALLILTVLLQIASLFTLLRVATGVASTNPPANQTKVIVVPSGINASVSVPPSTPQFQNPAGAGIDASLLLALLFVGANVVVIGLLAILYRKRKMKLFSLLVSLFLVFNVTELYFSFVLGLYSYFPTLVAFACVALTLLAAFLGIGKLTNGLGLLVALELGSSFPVLLQAPLNWIIPAVYAVFDLYAVYYGRLGKLVKEVSAESGPLPVSKAGEAALGEESSQKNRKRGSLRDWKEFGLLSVTIGDVEIGMADLAFYSMVPVVALMLKNVLAFFVVMAAVDAGLVLSFFVFRKKEVSPGLPIPILSGLLGLAALILI
jgi:hypothetical protein